jgi:TnpA family transposase
VEKAGGFAAQFADIEEVSAFHGDNYELLVARYFKADRVTALALAGSLTLQATSADHSVVEALLHAVAYWGKTRDFIPDHREGVPLDLSFASGNWIRAVRDRAHPGMLVKRHFEAMVFTYLAEELRTGDIAVAGASEFGDWSAHLLTFAECQPLIAEFCSEVGLPTSAGGFTAALKERHAQAAADLDAGYPDNADLVIDTDGVPVLKPLRGMGTSAAAVQLGEAIRRRMPERTLIQILARTAYWLGWWRHFGPASGSDPKLKDPQGRYVLTTFACGSNMGPYEAARHIPGITAHEISLAKNRHASIAKLNKAIAEVVNAFTQLDLTRAWGDGSTVATDGTQVDTYIDNLLAENHIRYGGFGGIAYHYVADHYIALFSRFVPCGAWEAIYIIDGLLANASDVKPGTIHADTQGQSFPVFTLAHLFGFDLMPRIRNWKDLIFFRHSAQAEYEHIEALFGETGRNVIDWRLIEKMWPDLIRVAISIREGRLNSVTMLRRLTSNSRRNEIYKAFREVGRSVRTVALLRYLADPALRRRVTAATNKVEAYNGFSAWLRFGNAGVIADNDPAEQEKIIKFNSLLANCVVFHTALDMTNVVRELIAEGWDITAELLAQLSPYLTEHINRFGIYPTDDLAIKPAAFDPALAEIDFETLDKAA